MPKIKCDICCKEFNTLYLLKRHQNKKYVCEKKTDETHTYQCNICNYKFKLIQNYNRHIKNKTCINKINNNNSLNNKLINNKIKLNNKLKLNIKLLNDKDNTIKIKEKRIKYLENTYLKKQERIKYSEKNVIYILTTEDNKKKRNYIIGKTINLTNRLSTYNKTIEHEIVYYKSCKNKENMNIIETMILTKLKDYKECSNRDRFILPLEKDISFFTNIIDDAINFFTNV